MAKHRIRETNGIYYPQERVFFFWWEDCKSWKNGDGCPFSTTDSFKSLHEANTYLIKKNNIEKNRYEVIHKVSL